MTLDQFTEKTMPSHPYGNRPAIVCKDGFVMSVQGSQGHYCSPRIQTKKYYSMEIGFPSEEEPLIMDYVDDVNNPTETVYGYVPTYIIQSVIDKHGGIDIDKTFKS